MEELMHTAQAQYCRCCYLSIDWSNGSMEAPTLLVLDEAGCILDDPTFATRLREWLKTLRKLNVSVILQLSPWPIFSAPRLRRHSSRVALAELPAGPRKRPSRS